MKSIITAFVICLLSTACFAQANNPNAAPGSTTGDPAASSARLRDTTGMAPNKSGSGTSTSGGKDENGDQGRDKMPESNMDVKQQPGKPSITNPGAR